MKPLLNWFRKSSRLGRRPRRACGPTRLEVEPLERRDLMSTLVTYNQGLLLTNVNVQTIYLGQDWASQTGTGYLQPGQTPSGGFNAQEQVQQLDTYLNSMVHSAFLDMLGNEYSVYETNATYRIGRGGFAGHYIDSANLGSAAHAPLTIGEDQVRNIIESDINKGYVLTPYANMLYFVYLPPNVTPLGYDNATKKYDAPFEAGHSSFTDASGRTIFYAVVQNPVGTYNGTGWAAGLTPFQAQTTISSHELAEAVTDPIIGQGWIDNPDGGLEIGDLAGNWLVGRQPGYSQFAILNGYTLQKEWSNVYQTGILPTWSAPTSAQSGLTVNALTTVTDIWGNAYLFGIGSDSGVYTKSQGWDGTWSSWTSLGAPSGYSYYPIIHLLLPWHGAKSIAVTTDGSAWRVFAIGKNNAVYTIASGDTSWTSLGGQAKQVAAGHRVDGGLEVFAIGTDNLVYSDIRTGTGSGGWAGTSWVTLRPSGTSTTMQAQSLVVDSATGKEQVFVIGLDNAVHTIAQGLAGSLFTGFYWGWSNWVSLGGAVKSIAVETTADGREEVFTIDSINYVDVIRQDAPGDWSKSYWDYAFGGSQLAQSLTVGRTAGGLEEVFAIDLHNNVFAIAQTAPNDGWTDSSWFRLGIQATQVAVVMNRSYQWGLYGAAWGDLTLAAISSSDNSVLTAQQIVPDGGWF